ncbi:MAG: penicillin-binding protein 1C [Chitinophagales bacterium]
MSYFQHLKSKLADFNYLFWLRKFFILAFVGIVLFKILDICFPFRINTSYSTIVSDKNGEILHSFLTKDEKWRMKTELHEITPGLRKAIVFKEDKYYFYHLGINPIAIFRAFFNNTIQSRRTSGASTITMQVARLLEPKKRTYANKMLEFFRALQLEWHFSKLEILQMYLNLVPYGGNIEGVKSAAVLYFDKLPAQLSLAEVTTLTVIPNRPTSLLLGKNNDAVLKVRNQWLKRFEQAHVFDETSLQDALLEPLNAKRKSPPRLAPHFSYKMKSNYSKIANIQTNLDYNKQNKTERLVGNYIKRLYFQHIRNAAAIVINNTTMQVEAYVGSADFFDDKDAGQVNGVQAIRSPGSTLKPFLYALAFDKGLLTPKMKISDVPINFSGYSPVNYDGDYNGMVTLEFALANSLNIPAVKILEQIGVDFFAEQLIHADFEAIKRKRKNLGLSLALGGCGVSLEELTRLYSSFANKGIYQDLRFLKADTLENIKEISLVSPSASFVITDILTQLTRPDLPKTIENSKSLPKIAWKTGTSYGRRDAWSIGYNNRYTIGVWVGNFSGEGVAELTGAGIATPLLFDIFNTIDYAAPKDWFLSPSELDFRWVCTETGLLPTEDCEKQVMDYYLPLVSSMKKCEHLQTVAVSADEKYSFCKSCMPNVGYKKKKYQAYLPEIVAFFEKQHINYDKIPPHNPKCERIFGGEKPKISSPVNGLDYLIDRADNKQLMLTCNVANDVEKIHWYIDDAFLETTVSTENAFFEPKKGRNKITCVDDKGRKSDIYILVKFL